MKLIYFFSLLFLFLFPLFINFPKSTDYKRHLEWTKEQPNGRYFNLLHKVINFIPVDNDLILEYFSIYLRVIFRAFVLVVLMKRLGFVNGLLVSNFYFLIPYVYFVLTNNQSSLFYSFFPDFQFYKVFTLPSFITLNVISWSYINKRLGRVIPFVFLLGRSSILLLLFYYFIESKRLLVVLFFVLGLLFFNTSLYNFIFSKVFINNTLLGYGGRVISYPLFLMIIKRFFNKKVLR